MTLRELDDYMGGPRATNARLPQIFGTSRHLVYNWRRRDGIPELWQYAISVRTGGALWPDDFGEDL